MKLEHDLVARALRDSGGNISRAARELGTTRKTLQSRMREYGMAPGRAGRPKRRLYAKRRGTWLAGGALAAAAVVAGAVLVKRGSRA